jgi:hypothetical protein
MAPRARNAPKSPVLPVRGIDARPGLKADGFHASARRESRRGAIVDPRGRERRQSLLGEARRRRRNRPGNAQAKGPREGRQRWKAREVIPAADGVSASGEA